MHQTDTAVSAVNTTASDFVFRRDEVPVQICKISVKYTCIGRSRDTRCLCVKYPSKTLVETVDNGELIPSSPVSGRMAPPVRAVWRARLNNKPYKDYSLD